MVKLVQERNVDQWNDYENKKCWKKNVDSRTNFTLFVCVFCLLRACTNDVFFYFLFSFVFDLDCFLFVLII